MPLIIEPGRSSANYWRDLWRYRELLYFLTWRDLAVRYKQTVIGVAWVVIRPALTMAAFVGFRKILGVGNGVAPEPIFILAAVLPWQLVSSGVTEAAASLLGNANLLAKVYFPRLVMPLAAVAASVVDFLVTLTLLGGVLLWYGQLPDARLVFLLLFILLAILLAVGLGLWLAALNVRYRDFRYVVPFVVQIGLFVSPIAFASANIPAAWQPLYHLNPMVGIIDGFRWSIIGGAADLNGAAVASSVLITVVVGIGGITYFRSTERGFADVI